MAERARWSDAAGSRPDQIESLVGTINGDGSDAVSVSHLSLCLGAWAEDHACIPELLLRPISATASCLVPIRNQRRGLPHM